MKNTYITIIILVLLVAGAVFIFATGKKAEAPVSETQPVNSADNSQSSGTNNNATVNVSVPPISAGAKVGTVKEFTVTGQNYSFAPSLLSVKKGDTVKITFKNVNGMHNLKIDEFNVGTQMIPGGSQETIQFVADKIGSFQYYCSVGNHRAMGMWGTLKVE